MRTVRTGSRLAIRAAIAAAALAGAAASAHEAASVRADFVPPAPGTYQLERIMAAPEGEVLDIDSRAEPLSTYTRGKVTVLSLMFTSCSDENGCPLAFYTLDLVQRKLESSPSARGRVRLVSLSFDPARDTPDVMKSYAGDRGEGAAAVPWHFLTARDTRALKPVLHGFGQDVSRRVRPPEGAAADMTHVLKVFLIDRTGWVREIYSTSFLVPQVVINDVQTLLLEEEAKLN